MPQVTDPALLQALNGGGKPAPVQQSPTIYRTPSKPLADQRPAEVQGDALTNSQKQQSIERGQINIEQDRLKLQSERNKFEATGGVEGQQAENKAAALTTNLAASMKEIAAIAKESPDSQQPGFLESTIGSFGPEAADAVSSSNRRDVRGAQFIAVDSALTLATGAAYTAEQLEGYMRNLFPNYFDDAKNIAAKKRRFQTIIESGRLQAGAKAPAIEQALAAVEAIYGPYEKAAVGGDKPAGGPLSANIPSLPESGAPGTPIIANGVTVGYFDQDGKPVQSDTGPNFDANGDPIPVDQLNAKADSLIGDFGAGVGDIAQGVGDMAGIVANPVNMAINAATGSQFSTDLGQSLRNATGLPESRNPVASAINRGGAAALTGAGVATGLARGAGMGGNAVVNALSQQPIQQGIAGASAGASSELTRKVGGGPIAQGVAGLAGGLGGFGVANAAGAVAKRVGGVPNALSEAAQRQGVQITPASAGGPATRRVSSAGVQSPLSAGPIIKASQTEQAQIGAAAARRSRNALPEDEAGQLVRDGADLFIKSTSAKGARLYDRAGEAAKGVTIKPKAAVSAIDGHIAELSKLKGTNASTIKALETLKSDIAGGVDVAGLRGARTTLGGAVFDGKLRTSNEQRIYKDVLNALSDDIDSGLRQADRGDAAAMFKTADKFWTQRVEQIDEVLQPILGKNKSGEEILSAVERMAQGKTGGVKRLASLMKELPEEQAQGIRETVISRLGRATNGRQDDMGETFSPATFLTNWNKMSPKGKAILFGASGLRRDLNDIAKLANATKESAGYANTSNSSGGIWGNLGLLAAGGVVSPGAAIGAGATQLAVGRLMASPRFANWLAKVPANPAAQRQYLKKLPAIASAQPIIANDIKSVAAYLDDVLAASPGRAAAQDEPDARRKPPAQ